MIVCTSLNCILCCAYIYYVLRKYILHLTDFLLLWYFHNLYLWLKEYEKFRLQYWILGKYYQFQAKEW